MAPAGTIGPEAASGYDTNSDGRIDYLQVVDNHDRIRHLFFDRNHDGQFDYFFDTAQLQDTSQNRTLLVLLDGISFPLVEQLRAEGKFRLFYPPGRLIGGFPTITDTIFADFFQTPRPFGYEAAYYDNQLDGKAGGASFYLRGGNEPVWPHRMLYRQPYLYDGLVYVLPNWAAGRELDYSMKAALEWLNRDDGASLAAIYMVNTDAIGHSLGHEALKDFLRRIDAALEKLVWQSRGKLRIVVLADHGINEGDMKRIDLESAMEDAGFNVTDRLRRANDIHVPSFGLVSHVAIYTRQSEQVEIGRASCRGRV